MHILVSNDDGYRAQGISVLVEALAAEHEISIVAPERNCSGASNSLTLDRGLRAFQLEDNVYYVDGTPTDTVHLALTGLLKKEPDMVVSGINAGANMGDDVLYSGTVAAAMEGRHLGLPAIAVSMNSFVPDYYETAAKAVVQLLGTLSQASFASSTILNINVPDIPWDEQLGALNDLVRQGKVRYIGCSTHPTWAVMDAIMVSELKNYARFVCEQPPYNLLIPGKQV